MRAPVFKPLFFQVKPLPCGAAQKVSTLTPRRPTHASENNISTPCRVYARSSIGTKTAKTFRVYAGSRSQRLKYSSRTKHFGGRTGRQSWPTLPTNEKTAAPPLFFSI